MKMDISTYVKLGVGLLVTGAVVKFKSVVAERNDLMNRIGRATNPDNFPPEMKTFVSTMSGVLFTGSGKKNSKKVKRNIEVAQLAEKTDGFSSPIPAGTIIAGPVCDDPSCCGSGCDKKK
jgi:hypothetical protein